MKKIAAILTMLSMVGCSTASKNIATAYVSPVTYQTYDCQQIGAESARLQTRVTQLGGRLDEAAANDQAIGVVGAVLFWPALFALGGTKQQEAEYANLKGQYEALHQASIEKKCGMANPSTTASLPAPTLQNAVAK